MAPASFFSPSHPVLCTLSFVLTIPAVSWCVCMSRAARRWAQGCWGCMRAWRCQQPNCCSQAPLMSESPSPAQVCMQTREGLQPWDMCHEHTLPPHALFWWLFHNPRFLPSQRMGTRLASLLGFTALIGAELFLPSSSLPLPLFKKLFFSSQCCSLCSLGVCKQVLLSFNCRKH